MEVGASTPAGLRGRTPEGGCVKYTLEFQEARLLLPEASGAFREAQSCRPVKPIPLPLPALGLLVQGCRGFNHKLDMLGAIAHAGLAALRRLLNIEDDAPDCGTSQRHFQKPVEAPSITKNKLQI